jgi:hypothetical protein
MFTIRNSNKIMVGENLNNISLEYKESDILCRATDGKHFKDTELYYRRKFNNPNLKVLIIGISVDETELSRGSKRTATPVYLNIMNLSTEVLLSEAGTCLIGFIPALSLSDIKITEKLVENGVLHKKHQKSCLTLLNRWVETRSLEIILKCIKTMNSSGPVRMKIGDECEEDIMCVFHHLGGKRIF